MKRIMFGTILAFAVASCGGDTEGTEETTETEINTEAVLELEKVTNEVEEGLQDLENSVETLNNDVDSLLQGI